MGPKKGKRGKRTPKAALADLQNAPPETVCRAGTSRAPSKLPDLGITPIPKSKSDGRAGPRATSSPGILTNCTNFDGVTSTPAIQEDAPVHKRRRETSPPPLFDIGLDVDSRISLDSSDDGTLQRRIPSPELSIRSLRSTYGGTRKRRLVYAEDSDAEDATSEAEPFLWDSPRKATPKKRKRIAKNKQREEWPANDEWVQKMAEEFERISHYELVYE